MGSEGNFLYKFGDFLLDPGERLLRRANENVPLTPKAFDTLCVLVENSGRLLEKSRLLDLLWADSFVEEGNLADNISKIRNALGDSRKDPKYIETVSRKGYRFIAKVQEIEKRGLVQRVDSNEDSSRTADGSSTQGERDSSDPASPIVKGVVPFFGATVSQIYSERTTLASQNTDMATAGSGRPRGQHAVLQRERRSVIAAVAALLFVATAGVAYYVWTTNAAEQSAADLPRSIAVLPFKPLSANSRDESLELGMSDTLITRLGTIRQVTVRPISAIRRYMDLEQDPVEAGRELRVESVLDGSIQRSGDRIRVTARLIRVQDAQVLWAETFEDRFTDIFAVQDSISRRIAGSLAPQLSGDEQREIVKNSTNNAEAYELYLKGRFFWSKITPDALQKSLEYYTAAIEVDPDYALAYAGMADSYNLLGSYGFWPMRDSHPRARAAAEKALQLDDRLAEAHASLAAVIADFYWDWAAADEHFRRAVDLNPNYPVARYWYSQHHARMGRLEESVEEARRAQLLDPLSSSANSHVALALYRARRHNEAAELLEKVIQFDPRAFDAHIFLGFVRIQQGRAAEAIAEFQTIVDLSNGNPSMLALLAYGHASAGEKRKAREILRNIYAGTDDAKISSFEAAMVYIGLREADLAFERLEKAVDDRAWQLGFLKVEPLFDPIRSDPRFQTLLQRTNLDF